MTHACCHCRANAANVSASTGGVSIAALPKSVDWRPRMGPAGDQGDCGSCWIWSAVNTLEGRVIVQAGKTFSQNFKLDLSEEQMVREGRQRGRQAGRQAGWRGGGEVGREALWPGGGRVKPSLCAVQARVGASRASGAVEVCTCRCLQGRRN